MDNPFGLVRIYVDFRKRNTFWRVVDMRVVYLVNNMLSYVSFFIYVSEGRNLSRIYRLPSNNLTSIVIALSDVIFGALSSNVDDLLQHIFALRFLFAAGRDHDRERDDP